MLPASPRAGRSIAQRPAQYPAQTRSVSRPRERERDGPARAVDYESGVAMANRERDRVQRSNTMRQVRPQRSMGSLPSSTRATSSREAQPIPPMPRPFNASVLAGPSSIQRPTPTPRAGSASSNSSVSSIATSSSGSSFLDRMRARNPGNASSQSSLELEQEENPKEEAGGKWYGSRERQVGRLAEREPLEDRRDRNSCVYFSTNQ